MANQSTSEDLLAHFDRPKTLELPDFEWVEEVIPFDSATHANQNVRAASPTTERFILVPRDTRRGVCWVLAWAGAIAVFAVATSVLIEFAYVFAAERALSSAARAGAMEATLPRATYQSVAAVVDRRLQHYPSLAKQLHFSLLQNGALVQTGLRQHEGDQFAVSLSGPLSAALPEWLRKFNFWRGQSTIQAHAEQLLPGRRIAYAASLPARN